MINKFTLIERSELKKKFETGVLLFPGNDESAMNYAGNTYSFRQDSSFLYYFRIDAPNMAGIIDIDENERDSFRI